MSQTPKLDEVIQAGVDDRLESFYTAIPARIKKYNHETQTATITIPIANATEDGKGEKSWHYPSINNVPVIFPGSSTGGGIDKYRITFPIGADTSGLYIVSTLPTPAWRGSDGKSNIELTNATHNHVSSGFFIPADTRGAPTDAPMDAMVLYGKKVKIGGDSGTQKTLKADALKTAIDNVITLLNAAIVSAGGSGISTTAWDTEYVNAKTVATEVK